MRGHGDHKVNMEMLRRNIARYVQRRKDGVTAAELAAEAGVGTTTLNEELRQAGVDLTAVRLHGRVNPVRREQKKKHSPTESRVRREPTWESMLAGVGADHD